MASDLGGVWRTVGGRRIFIKDGEDLATAMKNSGKFGNKTNNKDNDLYKNVVQGKEIEDEDLEIYTSGTNNIFRYPELADQQKASELISTFEEKQMLSELVQETLEDENSTGIQVYIGDETPVSSMKDCSVVTATYELEEGMRGTIGIIGPKRMDYDKVIGTLKSLQSQLDELYKGK